jgi:hypothetical protein
MISIPPHQLNPMLNQQPRFPSVPQSLPPRITNPQPSLINPQSGVPNQVVRLREPQKFNQCMPNISYLNILFHFSISIEFNSIRTNN